MSRAASSGLIRAIAQHIGPLSDLTAKTWPWASATFSGTRHLLEFAVDRSARIDAVLERLGDIDLPMSAHFVADLTVINRHDGPDATQLTIEALTIAAD